MVLLTSSGEQPQSQAGSVVQRCLPQLASVFPAEIIRISENNMTLPQSLRGTWLYLWATSSFVKKLLYNVRWKMSNPEGHFTKHIKAISPIVVPVLWTCVKGTQKYSFYLTSKYKNFFDTSVGD